MMAALMNSILDLRD